MFKLKLLLGVGILLLVNGCAERSDYKLMQTSKSAQELRQNSVNVSDRSIEYRILPQDRLDISLYKDPQQNSESNTALGQKMGDNGLLVNSAGYVPLPLIGKIKLAGLTQTQASDRITTAYKKYMNTPSVYVEVMNKRILVLGEVNKPGVVKLDREKITLFEALAMSGDFTDAAVRNNVVILSNNKQKGMQIRTVDMTNFDTMKYASLMLRPNDIVYVQPNDWKEFRVASDNYTAPLETITKVAAPFVTLKYLFQ